MKSHERLYRAVSTIGALVLASLVLPPSVHAIELRFSSVPGSEIHLVPGGAFPEFPEVLLVSDDDFAFRIDQVVGGVGSAVGLEGFFSDYFLAFANISEVSGPSPLVETAEYYEYAVVDIPDANLDTGVFLVGGGGTATSVSTDAESLVRFHFPLREGFPSYQGSDPDLLQFFGNNAFSMTLEMRFSPGVSLSDLLANGGSGAFTGVFRSTKVPDGGASAVLLGFGLAALATLRRAFPRAA